MQVLADRIQLMFIGGEIGEKAEEIDRIMHENPIQVLLLEFTGSGMRFKARYRIGDYVETRVSEDRLNAAIYKALINANIAMPSSDIIIHFADQGTELTISRKDEN
ncbi:hypothetical protein ACSAZL_07500 [Methanosarcina sp. T3]|uniref:hypothetical protein n=1 Tax=Methanosarcina sp. T3 TaxID=3439062 RepID=UPI003F831AEB